MKRNIIRLTGALTLVLLTLGGCASVPGVQGERISGRMVFAIDRDSVTRMGLSEEEFLEQMADNVEDNSTFNTPLSIDPAKGTVVRKRYEDARFLGVMVRFRNVPLDEFNGSTGNVAVSLTHEGGDFSLKLTADLGDKSLFRGPITPEIAQNAQVRVKFVFPGEVLETNGEADKRSAIWRPTLSEPVELTAKARDHGPQASLRWAIYAIVLVVIVGVGVEVGLRFWRRRRAAVASGPVEPPKD
ncbi:MAG: hypothetical protein HOQ05_09410 [Corynebacteriales bacterium]|nr:hypothetical protein [Mycobacteriales bacterium]